MTENKANEDNLNNIDEDIILDDEFSSNLDDLDISDEESWEDDLDDTSSYVTQNTDKSQINWFNIGIFGFIGMAILGVGYTYLPSMIGGSEPVAQKAPQQQSPKQASLEEKNALAAEALAPSLEENITKAGGLLDNPNLLSDIDNAQQVTHQNNADGDLFNVFDNPPQMSDNEIQDIFQALKQPTAPEVNDIETTLPNVVNNVDMVEPLPMPSDAIEVVADDVIKTRDAVEQISQINTQEISSGELDKIKTRMDEITSRLDTVMSKLENNQTKSVATTPSVNNELNDQMEATIDRLEKRIDTLSVAQKKLTSTPKKVAVRKVRKKTYKPKITKITWDLRGASSGQAYLAERGTQNLRTVNVGDNLNGIGRINSIAMENGLWIVRGTSGIIKQ